MQPKIEHPEQDDCLKPQTHQPPSAASAPSPFSPPPTSTTPVAASNGGRRKQAKPQKKNGKPYKEFKNFKSGDQC